nr:hypothetical protein [Tanacetum cinerariifolium]
ERSGRSPVELPNEDFLVPSAGITCPHSTYWSKFYAAFEITDGLQICRTAGVRRGSGLTVLNHKYLRREVVFEKHLPLIILAKPAGPFHTEAQQRIVRASEAAVAVIIYQADVAAIERDFHHIIVSVGFLAGASRKTEYGQDDYGKDFHHKSSQNQTLLERWNAMLMRIAHWLAHGPSQGWPSGCSASSLE